MKHVKQKMRKPKTQRHCDNFSPVKVNMIKIEAICSDSKGIAFSSMV